ncbi:ribosome-binding factor A [Wenyingzhuangia heitensis]|uniref:Ribosome-binding factor A n=1 Tax=Wenyingzhuangia heitensis TaxID=1487859 RepID=A0ABX0U6I8_9FLAO|nr:30S ribosome-binding factor RbfA [Wenyingzhuangia heitensis]NIJ44412.1 ribosome-binding factor A [Wenyingzhuangia heitensis]
MEETNRQKKIAGVIQKDLAEVLQADARNGLRGVIISVSKVNVTADLGQAKAYLSVFPSDKRDVILKAVTENTVSIRHELAQRTKHQLRRMPNLLFFGDDSLDYIENIDASLKGKDVNPIHNPEILDKRKKS